MLDNIKSSYFIKIIFFYLNEGKKLKIIRYNKYLQNIIDINLINYKLFSGRYIIYETNGEGKEFSCHNGELLFEGVYSNGKRNGKGKEYSKNGELIYEGNYFNGLRNGEAKEYYESNELKFEGEYLNGKRWNGKGYDKSGNIMYELNKGKGDIKEFYSYFGGLKFEGKYLNGERNGKGKEYFKNKKLKFEGEYFKGKKWNGKGYDPNGFIAYDLKNGKGYMKEYVEIYGDYDLTL